MVIQNKPYLFCFWESSSGMPGYIELCRKSIERHLSSSFKLVFLDFENSLDWINERDFLWKASIPRTKGRSSNLEGRRLAIFTGMLRWGLLAKYGGLWLDADQLIFSNFKFITPLIEKHDLLVGQNANGKVGNPIVGAAKNSVFVANLWETTLSKIEAKQVSGPLNAGWGEYGFRLLWKNWLDQPPTKPFVAPYGSLINVDPTSEIDFFAQNNSSIFDISPLSMGFTIFNNGKSSALREKSINQLIEEKTAFAQIVQQSEKISELSDWFVIRNYQAIEALNVSLMIQTQREYELKLLKRIKSLKNK